MIAVLATVLAALAGIWDGNAGSQSWAMRLLVCAVIGSIAVALAADRERREQRLRRLTVVAEAAQRAVLRAMPTSVGQIALAARYLSAADDALIGGDLYEVSATPFGVRMIVGDVRGKGLDAVQLAAAVVGAFRQSALTVTDLAGVAVALDEVVHAVSGDEDFVTAVLAEFHDDGTVAFVNCGHHPPMQVDVEGAVLLDVDEHAPPLGLGVGVRLTPTRRTGRSARGCSSTPTVWWRRATPRGSSSTCSPRRRRCAPARSTRRSTPDQPRPPARAGRTQGRPRPRPRRTPPLTPTLLSPLIMQIRFDHGAYSMIGLACMISAWQRARCSLTED